jgi:MFS family permease
VLRGLGSLPYLVIALPAGVWVDRIRRRRLLVAADAWRGLVTLSVPLAAVIGALNLPHLYVLAFLLRIGTVIFEFAYHSYLPHLVGQRLLVEGNRCPLRGPDRPRLCKLRHRTSWLSWLRSRDAAV